MIQIVPNRSTRRETRRKLKALPAALLAGAVLLTPLSALADGKKHGHSDHGQAASWGCPPGLAKKGNGCQPPGQAMKRAPERPAPHYHVGERIVSRYVVIDDPYRYGLDPRHTYWRSDDYVFRVDRNTGEVLALIGAVANILN